LTYEGKAKVKDDLSAHLLSDKMVGMAMSSDVEATVTWQAAPPVQHVDMASASSGLPFTMRKM